MGYIYKLSDPRTGEARYIGYAKHSVESRLRSHIRDTKRHTDTRYVINWIRILLAENLYPIAEELEQVGDNWQERERYWISYGMEHGWKLTNLTGGGDGCPNPAPEVRKAMSDKKIGNSNAKGHTVSEELRKASSLRNKTRIITEETRKKKSVSMMGNKRAVGNRSTTGRIRTEEHKEHIRLSLVNKPPMTPEALERFKLAMIGHKVTDEGRANMSKGQLGNQNSLGTHRTDEQKENIGEGIKKAWDRRKESGPILISEETRQKLKDAQKRRRDREKKGKE